MSKHICRLCGKEVNPEDPNVIFKYFEDGLAGFIHHDEQDTYTPSLENA